MQEQKQFIGTLVFGFFIIALFTCLSFALFHAIDNIIMLVGNNQ